MDESLYTLKEYAPLIRLSESTVYRSPAKYHMFRVGKSWRANKESLKRFEQAQFNDNNVYRLAVVGSGSKKCRSTKEVKCTGLTSQLQAEREFADRLAQRTKSRRKNTMTN